MGHVRTIAQETASQIALRDCSKEVGVGAREGQYVCDFVKGKCMQSSTWFFFVIVVFLQKVLLVTRSRSYYERF